MASGSAGMGGAPVRPRAQRRAVAVAAALLVIDGRDPVPAAPLGPVEGPVRRLDEAFLGAGVLGVGGDTDAHRHPAPGHHLLVPEGVALDPLAQALGHRQGSGAVGVGERDHELLAPVPRRHVGGPRPVFVLDQELAQGPEDLVAGEVTQGVVVVLEVIDIEEEQPHRGVAPVGLGDHLAQGLLEEAVVVEAGEPVVDRELGEGGEGLLQLLGAHLHHLLEAIVAPAQLVDQPLVLVRSSASRIAPAMASSRLRRRRGLTRTGAPGRGSPRPGRPRPGRRR